jgi:hypothetical protein
MPFRDHNHLRKLGYDGFQTISALNVNYKVIPDQPGVYLILMPPNVQPQFLKRGSAGFIALRDPNQPIKILEEKWVKETIVLYCGKAGGINMRSHLRGRLNQYLRHGRGHSARHWGGRYIWQLENAHDLIVCWKVCKKNTPRAEESNLLKEFYEKHHRLPFANLIR